jgi:hypothetical protein
VVATFVKEMDKEEGKEEETEKTLSWHESREKEKNEKK